MKVSGRKSYERRLGLKEFFIYFFIPLAPLIIFWFLPMLASLLISFTNWNYVSPNFDLVGVENYKYILQDDFFWQALKTPLSLELEQLCLYYFLDLYLHFFSKEILGER